MKEIKKLNKEAEVFLEKMSAFATAGESKEFNKVFDEYKLWLEKLEDKEKLEVLGGCFPKIKKLLNVIENKASLIEDVLEDNTSKKKANDSYGRF